MICPAAARGAARDGARAPGPGLRLLVAACLVLVQSAAAAAARTSPFEGTIKDGKESRAWFCWASGATRFHVKANGTGTKRSQGLDEPVRLPVRGGEYIEHLWFKPYRGDLLVLFEATAGEYGRGGVCRYRQQPWRMRWCHWIPAFNVVAAVSQDQTVYVGGIGYLARLNASSGKFIWQREGLYQADPAFNIFGVPTEDGPLVTFEATPGAGPVPDKLISLERRTGKTARIEISGTLRPELERSSIGLARARGSCASWAR